MSTRVIRYCDVCETDYTERPDWMILSAPNAPEEVEAEWDFCCYACLVRWATTDEVDDAGPDFGEEHDRARAMGPTQAEYSAMSTSQVVEQRQEFHVEQPDGTPPPPAEVRRVHPGEPTREQAVAQAKLDAAMAAMGDKPPMTLMEALASGQLNFNRGTE